MKRYVVKIKALLIGAAVLSLFAASPSFSAGSNPLTRLKDSIKKSVEKSKAVKQEVKAAKADLKQAQLHEQGTKAGEATAKKIAANTKGKNAAANAALFKAKIAHEDAGLKTLDATGRLNAAKEARGKTLGGRVSNTAKVVKAKVQSAANRVATPFKRK